MVKSLRYFPLIILAITLTLHGEQGDSANKKKSVHEKFEIEKWLDKFPLRPHHRRDSYEFESITSPFHICNNEQLRDKIKKKIFWGVEETVDIFIMAKGEPAKAYLTKTGGVPYRPKDKPWPLDSDGDPMLFLGQVCFADSKDIVGELPDDVLLVFQPKGDFPFDRFHAEWHKIGIEETMTAKDVPKGVEMFKPVYGHIFRTKAYPQARPFEERLEFGGKEVHNYFIGTTYLATQIGNAPFFFGDGKPEGLDGRVICTINSVFPVLGRPFPLINHPAPLSPKALTAENYNHDDFAEWRSFYSNMLMFLDVGCLYIAIDDKGELSYEVGTH